MKSFAVNSNFALSDSSLCSSSSSPSAFRLAVELGAGSASSPLVNRESAHCDDFTCSNNNHADDAAGDLLPVCLHLLLAEHRQPECSSHRDPPPRWNTRSCWSVGSTSHPTGSCNRSSRLYAEAGWVSAVTWPRTSVRRSRMHARAPLHGPRHLPLETLQPLPRSLHRFLVSSLRSRSRSTCHPNDTREHRAEFRLLLD